MKKDPKIIFENSLLSFTSSLMNYYNVPCDYNTHLMMDYLLSKKYRHIAVILLDGLGRQIIEDNIENGGLFKTHQIIQLTSVYPPTTVAATTTIRTGLSPVESGYLGWHLYLEENDPSIVLFKNKEYLNATEFNKYQVSDKLPAECWFKQIKKAKVYEYWPKTVREDGFDTFDKAVDAVEENLNSADQTFTYLYWDEPDATIHEFGTTSHEARRLIRSLEERITQLKEDLPNNSCVFIIADHGLVDCESIDVKDHMDVFSLLRKPFSGEARSAHFYVKKGCEEEFVEKFNNKFGNDFKLYDRRAYVRSPLMFGKPHDDYKIIVGDYVAVAITNKCFIQDKVDDGTLKDFVAHHAGYTKEELMVPVIMLRRKDVDDGE